MCPDCTGQLGCPLSYPTNPGPFFHCLPTTTGSRRNSTSSNTKHFVASCVLQLRERLPGPGALNRNPTRALHRGCGDYQICPLPDARCPSTKLYPFY